LLTSLLSRCDSNVVQCGSKSIWLETADGCGDVSHTPHHAKFIHDVMSPKMTKGYVCVTYMICERFKGVNTRKINRLKLLVFTGSMLGETRSFPTFVPTLHIFGVSLLNLRCIFLFFHYRTLGSTGCMCVWVCVWKSHVSSCVLTCAPFTSTRVTCVDSVFVK
jgi:hypothetical protein